ncbi:MAG: nuclear transport factor 2 family protein [Flavobacteriales bacterium]|nr:nuclear transport factor 2 family protein [Flavobacteriales bacterium]
MKPQTLKSEHEHSKFIEEGTIYICSCPIHDQLWFIIKSRAIKQSKSTRKNNDGIRSKQIVRDFIEAMRTSNVDTLKTMITDDFSWWIIGKPEYLATAGEHDTEYFLGFFKGDELFPEGTDFKTTSMTAEGNRVAAEAEFKAKTAMGTYYENYYHFLFIIENGKVKRMKEYMDTYNAKVTFNL